MTRGSERRHRHLAVPAERAWDAIARWDLLHLWFPGVVDCRAEGSSRWVTTAAGLTLEEQILLVDAVQRRLQYRIAGGFFSEHLATVDVLATGPDECVVVYATDAAPATMAVILGGAMEGALVELARQLEAGTGPLVDALVATEPAAPPGEATA